MVRGLDTFRKYFSNYGEQYVLIGGAACDIVFESNDVLFRATRDLDMVLIVEALTPQFGETKLQMDKNLNFIDLTNQRMIYIQK